MWNNIYYKINNFFFRFLFLDHIFYIFSKAGKFVIFNKEKVIFLNLYLIFRIYLAADAFVP